MVKDTGTGIPETQQNRIFDEFIQLNNPERNKNKGFGLGLSICKRLCSLMSVPLTLQSTPGVGTSFQLLVPKGKAMQASFHNTETPPAIQSCNLQGNRILVIDDYEDIRDSMQQVLLDWGASEVKAVEGAEQALACIDKGFLPDLVISDYRLQQNRTGIDTVREIFATIGNQLPVIIITGDTSPESLELLQQSGIPIIHKPIELQDLANALK